METTLKVIGNMVKEEILLDYAIGGAMALAFYDEPTSTFDLDIFVFLPRSSGSNSIVSLNGIYEYCHEHEYKATHEHLMIEGIAVQFIPAYNKLVEEAVKKAKKKKYGRLGVKVIGLEYLMAIMVQTGRPKDKGRLLGLIEKKIYNKKSLLKILSAYGLNNAWQKIIKTLS